MMGYNEADSDLLELDPPAKKGKNSQVKTESAAMKSTMPVHAIERESKPGSWLFEIRLILGGAVFGAALAGIVGAAMGSHPMLWHDIVGSVVGATAFAFLSLRHPR